MVKRNVENIECNFVLNGVELSKHSLFIYSDLFFVGMKFIMHFLY